jgi:oligopeptide/dipeptide ABC transporter ATP-binding protein
MANSIIYKIKDLNIDVVTLLDRKRLIEDFNLEISKGEIIGLVGETGAGKSVSMMASVGLLSEGLQVSTGQVSFEGDVVDAKRQKLLRDNLASGVSLLFQNAKGALNPFMRSHAQIERVLKMRDVPRENRSNTINDLISSVGMDPEEIGPKYAHEISGGQAQRVAIACALATQPEMLIADEPSTALDVTTQRDLLDLLKNLCRNRNMSLILITHNLALVSENCDRIVIMHAGHIVENGRVTDVFANPLHPYTKGLISAIPDVDRPKELIPLEGSVWGGDSNGNRCRFSHRCAYEIPECTLGIPEMLPFNDHLVRCVLYKEGYSGEEPYDV